MSEFDEAMLPRLRDSRTEASKLVLDLAQDMALADACLSTIESLPARQTVQLRRWVDNWEAYHEWLRWTKRGWSVERLAPNRARRFSAALALHAPEGVYKMFEPSSPSMSWADIVAAAADVAGVEFVDWGPHPRHLEAFYEISRGQ